MDFSANHIGFVIATLGRDRKLRGEVERLDTQRKKARP